MFPYFGYDGMANATGLNSGLTRGNMTTSNRYSNCGTSGNNYTPSGLLSTGLGYDTTTSNGGKNTGNLVGMTTPNANAGIATKNCSTLGVSYTNCLSFDNTVTDSLVTGSSAQTLNTSANYSGTVGNGLQPATITDPNTNQTAYTYDNLGRALTTTLPGNTSGTPNTSMVYANWCIATGAQTPCVEEDTITLPDHTAPTNTVTTRKFYDGNGHLVETRTPAPNGQDVVQYTLYDVLGRAMKESRPYYVTAGTITIKKSIPPTSFTVTTKGFSLSAEHHLAFQAQQEGTIITYHQSIPFGKLQLKIASVVAPGAFQAVFSGKGATPFGNEEVQQQLQHLKAQMEAEID